MRTHTAAALLAAALAGTSAHAQTLEVVAEGLDRPCDMTVDPDGRLLIVEQDGLVRVIEPDGTLRASPFIEVDRSNFTDHTSNWERGLLGIALDPAYADNRRFYLYYSDKGGDTVTSRFTASGDTSADWSTEEVLLEIDQPFGNHNGGCLRFGPDGMLYIGPGDGGKANDTLNAGQRLDTHLGKLLRIDVTGTPDPGTPYAIPADNPFVGRDDALPEIWSFGLRNPWKFEFDSMGRLWIADVGQNRFEYVHVQPAGSAGGENYGWKIMEGLGEFKAGRKKRDDPDRLDRPAHLERGLQPPVFEYRHHPIGSITGGYFYEGDKYPWLRGRYLCADFMSGRVWSFRPRQRTTPDGRAFTAADDIAEHTEAVKASFGGKGPGLAISSFGISPDGQTIYVLDHKAGRVLRFAD
jgi:glucose/arabinose dehydrogenase